MVMTVNRFEPKVCEKGMKFVVDNKGIVVIKDHATDKIVAMVNMNLDPNVNVELAENIMETIDEYPTDSNEN